jgi:hypothetical protein
MYKITTVHTRPDTTTPFYRRDAEVASISTDAKLNGQLLSEESVLSEDKLTVTYVAVWDSFVSFDTFSKVEAVAAFRVAKAEHNRANNIIQFANKQEAI